MHAPPTEPGSPPDWTELQRDVLCPLCEYNLRGLIEPRCPECGHQFMWSELLDESRWKHPWLFEHARGHRVRGLFQTISRSILPNAFWDSVHPTHKPRPLWLALFWLVCASAVLLPLPWLAVPSAVRTYSRVYESRQALQAFIAAQPNHPQTRMLLRRYGSGPAAAKAMYPLPSLAHALGSNLGTSSHRLINATLPISLAYLAWPWLTAATLQIFRQTLRRTRIMPIHIVRCAIYSFSGAIVVLPVLLLVVRERVMRPTRGRLLGELDDPVIYLALLGFLLILTWRLTMAYRQYLRFPQAAATCVASQVIVGLIFTICYVFAVVL